MFYLPLLFLADVSFKAIMNITTQKAIPRIKVRLSGPGCIALSKYSGATSNIESNIIDLLESKTLLSQVLT